MSTPNTHFPSTLSKEEVEQKLWDCYNGLLQGPDLDRMRKIFARYELFLPTIELPGDIVECGVFKGTGFMFFLKCLLIRTHGSQKRVVGFDVFDDLDKMQLEGKDEEEMKKLYELANVNKGITMESIYDMAEKLNARNRVELISGDICETAQAYRKANPGFRISLLNLDLDLARPTKGTLEALWDLIVPGGIVMFDEYALPRWSESQGADEFFKERGIKYKLKMFPWAFSPTAYLIKE